MIKNLFLKNFASLLGLIFIFSNVQSVRAQDTGDYEFTLEEITVTAQKREENQQKIAAAMEVISGEDLKEIGKTDLVEILSTLSNATIQKAQDGIRVTLRGVYDNSDAGSGQSMAAPSVAVNIDGVTSNRKDTGSGLFDVERVEVLYGPQSTLYATNSPGGIVNIVTASPKLDMFEGSATLEVGNYGLLHTEGAVNVPISEQIAFRAAFTTQKNDGYLSNGGDNKNTKSARLKGLYQPNENLSFQLTAEYSKDKGSGYSGGVEPFIDDSDVDDPWTATSLMTGVEDNDQEKKKISANIDLDTKYAVFSLVPAYTKGEGNRTMVEVGGPNLTEEVKYLYQDTEEKSVEFRVASPADFSFSWIVGYIYYYSDDSNWNKSLDYIQTGVGSYMDKHIEETITAIYGNITYPVREDLRLSAGIRKGTDSFDQIGTQSSLQTDGTYAVATKVQEMDAPTEPDWKFGVEYDLDENTMLYTNYSTSYRVQSKYRSLADPQKMKAYSAGSKSRFFNNQLQLNTSAYYYDYSNYLCRRQVDVWVADTDGDWLEDTDETEDDSGAAGQGDGRMYGVDVSASAIITSNDKLDLSLSWEKSEWTDMYFDYEHETELQEVDDGASPPITVAVEDEDFTGKEMVLTPAWSINLAYSHNFMLSNGGAIKAAIDSNFQTSCRITWKQEEYPYNYQEAHHIENASVTYTHSNGMWTLTGYVKNIFEYPVKAMYRSDNGGFMSLDAPRTYGAILNIRF